MTRHRSPRYRRTRRLLALAALLALPACASESPPPRVAAAPVAQQQSAPANLVRVPMVRKGGSTFSVPVCISTVCGFPFLLDSGASDVSVSPMVFKAMVKDGLVTRDDVIDVRNYATASGQSIEGLRFRMPALTVGGITVRGVVGSVSPGTPDGMLLLGQSFLQKFRTWSIDNVTHELVLVR